MTFTLHYEPLVGQCVSLEPLAASHAQGLLDAGQTHTDWAYLPIPGFTQMEEVHQWITQAHAMLAQKMHYTYAIVDQLSGKVIGSTRYMNVRARDKGLEVGYSWLARDAQGTAANPESKLLLLQNAFERCGAMRVELMTDARNVRSQRAIEKLGAQREGVLRKHRFAQGGFVRDSVLYSIVDDEWPAVRDKLLARVAQHR